MPIHKVSLFAFSLLTLQSDLESSEFELLLAQIQLFIMKFERSKE